MAATDDWTDQLIDAFNARSPEAVGALMTDDVEYVTWHGDAWTTIRGHDRVVELVADLDRAFSSDFTLRKTFAVVTENGFAVEYTEQGTQDRGPAPTGRRFALRNVMVGELLSGKICRLTDYSDVIAYRAQMGSD